MWATWAAWAKEKMKKSKKIELIVVPRVAGEKILVEGVWGQRGGFVHVLPSR
jgi:hypothetical protein